MSHAIVGGPWMATARRSSSAHVKLLCLPYAGAGASLFHTWTEELGPALEVCPLQLPGRENRVAEPLFLRVEPLVQSLAQAISPALDGRYALFGHSMGALVAFELTRELRRRGRRAPEKLLVAAHPAPHLRRRWGPIHALPESRFVQALRRLHGTPEEVFEHGELRALMLPLLRADFEVCETYVHQPDAPLECPIAVFGGRHDAEVNRRELEGWREHTRAEFSIQLFNGGHFFIHTARPALLAGVREELAPSSAGERSRW